VSASSVAEIQSLLPDIHIKAINVVTSVENSEDMEDVFVIKYDDTHVINMITPRKVLRASVTENVVATPLPPWNLSQTGNMCPSTARSAYKQCSDIDPGR